MQAEINKTRLFLQNLRYLVNKTGRMDCEIASELGIHKVSFSRYFAENRIPKRTVQEKMASFFQVPLADLLGKDLQSIEQQATPQTPEVAIPSDEFTQYVEKKVADLQQYINQWAFDLLAEYAKRVKQY